MSRWPCTYLSVFLLDLLLASTLVHGVFCDGVLIVLEGLKVELAIAITRSAEVVLDSAVLVVSHASSSGLDRVLDIGSAIGVGLLHEVLIRSGLRGVGREGGGVGGVGAAGDVERGVIEVGGVVGGVFSGGGGLSEVALRSLAVELGRGDDLVAVVVVHGDVT